MEILYTQAIYVIVFFFLVWRIFMHYATEEEKAEAKKHKLMIYVVGIMFLLFVASPVKKTVPERTSVETAPDFIIPKKVEVKEATFKEKQENELKILRKENKENEKDI